MAGGTRRRVDAAVREPRPFVEAVQRPARTGEAAGHLHAAAAGRAGDRDRDPQQRAAAALQLDVGAGRERAAAPGLLDRRDRVDALADARRQRVGGQGREALPARHAAQQQHGQQHAGPRPARRQQRTDADQGRAAAAPPSDPGGAERERRQRERRAAPVEAGQHP